MCTRIARLPHRRSLQHMLRCGSPCSNNLVSVSLKRGRLLVAVARTEAGVDAEAGAGARIGCRHQSYSKK